MSRPSCFAERCTPYDGPIAAIFDGRPDARVRRLEAVGGRACVLVDVPRMTRARESRQRLFKLGQGSSTQRVGPLTGSRSDQQVLNYGSAFRVRLLVTEPRLVVHPL